MRSVMSLGLFLAVKKLVHIGEVESVNIRASGVHRVGCTAL